MQRDFDFASFQFTLNDLVDVRLTVVHANCLSQHGESVLVLGSNDGHIYVNVGQKPEVAIIHDARSFAHVARAMEFYGGRDRAHCAIPDACGDRVPGDFDSLSGCEAAYVGLVDEGAHQHVRKISFLQK